MKSLLQYITEYKTIDEIKIYDGSKEILPKDSICDKETFDEMIVQNNFTNETLKLINQQSPNKWKTLPGIAKINTIQPSGEYFVQGNIKLTYNELIEKIESGEYILIIL